MSLIITDKIKSIKNDPETSFLNRLPMNTKIFYWWETVSVGI